MNPSFDVVVIGSGPGGYVAAIRAMQRGLKAAIVERSELGGVCLNWGCIPTKALLKSAEMYTDLQEAEKYGLKAEGVSVDFAKVIQRSREVAKQNSAGVQFLMKKNKVQVFSGTGKILAKGLVEVSDTEGKKQTLSAKNIIIATGASARQFPQYPIDGKNIITYRHALALENQAKSMLIIGAGAIGVEFAYFFNSLGTKVHLVEMLPQVLPVEDSEISDLLRKSLQKQGIDISLEATVSNVTVVNDSKISATVILKSGEAKNLEVDRILVAVGMVPNTQNLGLEAAGVKLDARGFVQVNEFLESSVKGIYAIGDCAGHQLLAHKASSEGEVAVSHMVDKAKHGLNYNQVPGCTYCQPQVASVGLTERACKEKKIAYKVGRFPFSASGKARAIGHTEGLVKLIFGEKYGELLGAHILGSEATELLAELGLALKLESTWEEIAECIHAHPTLSEAVMEAAWDSQALSPHL